VSSLNKLPAGTYTFSYKELVDRIENTASGTYGVLLRRIVNGQTIDVDTRFNASVSTPQEFSKSVTFTLTESDIGTFKFVYLYSGFPIADTQNYARFYDFQVESGSIATDYEPYQDQTYFITFSSEAGTVYGGALDVTTGVLTVDRAEIELDENWYWYIGSTQPSGFTVCSTTSFPEHIVQNYDYISNMFKKANRPYVADMKYSEFLLSNTGKSAYFCFKNETGGTVQEFKDYIIAQRTAGTPIQVVYELATPIIYQLTP